MNGLAKIYGDVGRHADALKLHKKTLAQSQAMLGPDHPVTLASMNHVAWDLATLPDPRLREPQEAIELAKRAVESAPNDGNFWNTLGVANYRTGDWKAAVAALEKSIELREGGDGSDFFFRAMAHWQLDQANDARKWHEQAVEWMEKNNPHNVELNRFRAEAAELLGITEPQSPTRPQPVENEVPNTDNPTPASPPTTDN
jgi:tetratricopeptide (TPR) repeat protein